MTGRKALTNAETVEETLASGILHEQWWQTFLDKANRRFLDTVFDALCEHCGIVENEEILDAGCGNCTHAIALARRGAQVFGVDFSDIVLDAGRTAVQRGGLSERVRLQREDLTALSFPDDRFKFVVCWGVMMHVPEVEKAISELARVTAPGGVVVVHENNRTSLEAVARRLFRKHVRRDRTLIEVPAGDEYWKTTAAGTLLARVADIEWTVNQFRARGFRLEKRLPVQFTELYTKLHNPIARRLIHGWNRLWWRWVRDPNLAFGNLVILRKPPEDPQPAAEETGSTAPIRTDSGFTAAGPRRSNPNG